MLVPGRGDNNTAIYTSVYTEKQKRKNKKKKNRKLKEGFKIGIFSFFKRGVKHKAVFCGLDNSGKTTIITFLQTGHFVEHTPTMGKVKRDLEVQGTKISLIDMGGQTDFRSMWLGELQKDTKVVVFVVDRADRDRFPEARRELRKLIPIIKDEDIKLLIFANKTDLPDAAPLGEIYEFFQLDDLESFEIMPISAKTGYGMVDAFIKLYTALTGKPLKRHAVAEAISIYSKSGVPLVTRAKDDVSVEIETLQGGFLAAITQFADMKMGNNVLKIEGEDGRVFIVLRSKNFIGGLLWHEQLDIPIEQSEEALRDLLNHLDNITTDEEPEQVEYHVAQYCTNLL